MYRWACRAVIGSHRQRAQVARAAGNRPIKPDTEAGAEKWLKLNVDYAKTWPNITVKKAPVGSENSIHWARATAGATGVKPDGFS